MNLFTELFRGVHLNTDPCLHPPSSDSFTHVHTGLNPFEQYTSCLTQSLRRLLQCFTGHSSSIHVASLFGGSCARSAQLRDPFLPRTTPVESVLAVPLFFRCILLIISVCVINSVPPSFIA